VINKKNMMAASNKVLWSLLAMLTVFSVWKLIVTLNPVENLMPSPISVLAFFFRSFIEPIGMHTIQRHILFSLERVLIGFLIASVLGIIVGIGMGSSKLFRSIVRPIFEMLRPIPPIAWIPLAILWLGIGEVSKYFIIFIGSFTQVTLNSFAGAVQVDPTLIGAARMLGASERQIFTKIIIPSATPNIFSGLQIAVSTSWMAVLAAEMVRSSEGAGWIIIMGSESGNTVQILAGMIAIGFFGFLIAEIMHALERKMCAWNVRGR